MELRTEIRRRLRTARDWNAFIDELDREIEALPTEAEKSERLYEVGLLCEELVPDRDRALERYQRAWRLNPANLKALTRAREVYRQMGRLEMVAKLGELELQAETDPKRRAMVAGLVGEALIDLGQKERAQELLTIASEGLPDETRFRDALAATEYDVEGWIEEVERLSSAAEKGNSQTAARMCLRAARILRLEMPDDPSYEQMLRKVLSYDPQNEHANAMLEAHLGAAQRWDDLAAHHEKRAYAAADEADRAALYRQFGLEWAQRFQDRERAALFMAKALEAAYQNGAHALPSQPAAFSLLREVLGGRKEWNKLLALSDQALAAQNGEDEKLYAALVAGLVSWKELGDLNRARSYFDHVRRIAPENPVIGEFDAATGATPVAQVGVTSTPSAPVAAAALGGAGSTNPILPEDLISTAPQAQAMGGPLDGGGTPPAQMPDVQSGAAVAAPIPPVVQAPAAPAEEVLSDAQKQLMDAAAALEGTPDKAVDAYKKAIAADPTKRAPRRALARVLRKGEKWQALAEALKDEEAKAAKTPDEKVQVLGEMVELYREKLKNDAQAATYLQAMSNHRPDDLGLLDQLAAQYEAMKRFPDVVATLNKKAAKLQDKGERVAIHLRVANLYLEKFSNQAEAIKAFEAALELDPDNLEAAGHLKSVYEKRRDWEKLIALTRREIARIGDAQDRLLKTVELAKLASEKLKKPAVSIDAWADVLALDPTHAEALGELEKLYEREKRWDKLAEVVGKQAELAPDAARRVAALQKLGILYTEKVSDNDKAIAAWRQLLAVEPENRRAQDALKKLWVTAKSWGELQAFYAGQGKIDEYVRVLERQVETEDDATKIDLSGQIAVLYRDQLGKPDRAMRAFEKVLSLDARNLEAAEALIPLYQAAKDHKKLAGVLEIQLEKTTDRDQRQDRIRALAVLAEQQLRDKGAAYGWWLKAFEENHEDVGIRAEVERLAKDTGGWQELVDAYERAYRKFGNPGDALPLISVVARVQESELGETDRALETNRKILAVDESNADAVDALERLYLAKQQYGELLAIYAKKLDLTLDPDARKTIQYKTGQLYEEEIGDDDKAIAAYKAILDAAGDEREALAALDRIYERKGAHKELADILVRELAIVSSADLAPHVALKFRLGQVREKQLGDVAGAIDAYRDILELDATHEGARRALEARLKEDQWQLQAANILEPIYERLEAAAELIGVHEIQLKHEKGTERRVALLLRIGELAAKYLSDERGAFDAYARAFREDPTRAEARAELERLSMLLEGDPAAGADNNLPDGARKLVELYEAALARTDLDTQLQHSLSLGVAEAYEQRLENTEKAVEYYRRALNLQPEDREALEALDRLFSRDEKFSDLLEIYRKKVELSQDPEDRLTLLFRIASLWEEMLGNPEEAIATYKEILGHDAVNLRALKALDRLFLGQQHWRDLADNLTRQLALVDERHEQVTLLLRLAELRETKLKEVAAAVDTYRQALDLAPDDTHAVTALERLGSSPGDHEHELTIAQILEPVYRARDDWQKQVGVYEIMVRHAFDPARKIELLHRIGELYEVGGEDGEQAFATYARALREDPAGEETRSRLERLARVMGKWEALVQLLDEVAGASSDDELKVMLLTRVAQIHEIELGSDEAAVATYQRVLQASPKQLAAATAIQTIHERNGDYPRLVEALKRKSEIVDHVDEKKALLYKAAQIEEEVLENADAAIATYRMVFAVDEIDQTAMDALERLYIRLERWNPLKDIYAKKAELAATPDEKQQMLFILGQVYDRELGDVGKAIETYQQILDLDPEELNAIQALDRLYGQAGRWYDLMGILEREVDLSQSTGETVALKYRIGQLWERELKDLGRAIEAYREALSMDPAHEPTVAALQGLLHGEGEPVLAAQVLEPIYEQAAEFERLIDVYEVMTTHAPDAFRRVELLHRIADLYEKRLDRYDAAFEAFGRALPADPGNELTLANLERLADATRAWDSLARLYDGELKKILDVPRQVDLLLRLARVYEEELGQPEKAIETYRRVLDADGENRAAIHALDRLFEGAQRWAELAEILRKEIRLAGSDSEVLAIEFRLGQIYEQALRDLPAAIDVYREILAQDASHGPTLGALELLFLEGNYQMEIAAILEPLYRDAAQWEKLHKIHEVQLEKLSEPGERQVMYGRLAELSETKLLDSPRAFRWMGAAFAEDPRQERVGEEVERLARDTSSWDELVGVYTEVLARRQERDIQRAVLLKVARVYDAELRDPTRAEEAYLRVLSLDPKDPDALAALDRIYEQAGMYTELAEILRRRVEVTMDRDEIIQLYFRLGRLYSDVIVDLDEAVRCYEKILGEDSRNREALEALERVYFRREEWQKLYDIYEKMVDVARGDQELAEVYAHMARISSEALGDDDRAIDLWGRVMDLRGEEPIALTALADIHERREQWRDLVEIVEREVRIAQDPAQRVPLYKRLGRVWAEKLGRDRNALEAWLEAYRIEPTDLETLRALASLYRATQAWEELSSTLQQILDVGQTSGEVTEDEMIELFAQLGQLEGDVLGRTQMAVDAWRKVLVLNPEDFRALGALEALFVREGRWEECIDVLDKRAAVLEDQRQKLDTLLQAASIWEEKVGNLQEAARSYERVRSVEPSNTIASQRLETIYRDTYQWKELSEVLLERVEHSEEVKDRIRLFQTVARIYEEEMGDQESAFVVLQAAFREDYSDETTAKELERLATAANKWEELLADYSQIVAGLEHSEPEKAADLWVKIARWYGALGHMDYAIHSAHSALNLDQKHVGALTALADFHRKRGAWGELIDVLGRAAALEPDPGRKVQSYIDLAELLENQLGDPLQSMGAYRSALDTDPRNAEALDALDRLYRRHEMWEQLIDVLTRKAEASPDPDDQVRLKLEIGRLWDDRLNEPQQAIDAFRDVLVTEPRSLQALRALERLYEKTGQSEQYLDILEQEQDASPTDAEKIQLYQRMASAWEERFGKLDRAAECLEKILVLDERHHASYRELERLYRQEKKWDSLVDTYRRHILAAGDPGTRIDLYCAMGQVYEEELRDFDRAIESYNDVLSFDADEPRALEALGRLYEKIERWDAAIDVMNRLTEQTDDPRLRVDLLSRVGKIMDERMDDPTGAEERFLAAIGQDPSHLPTMFALTQLYKKRGDWQKAAQMMVRAETYTTHPLEKIRLLSEAAGIYHKRLHDEARAMEYYAATIALDPEHVESGEPLAELYFREQRWAELEPILDMLVRKAGQLKKDNRQLNELYYRTAKTADELGNRDKALKFYKMAYDLDSTFLPTLLGRANLLYKMEDWDGAGKIYQTILVQHRDSQKEHEVVEIYFRLGQVRLKLGERKKALNMFEKALEIDPAHAETLNAVIELQGGQGDYEAVVHAKRSLLARADENRKFKILDEIGDIYHDKLQNPQKSIAAYLEALEVKPDNHVVLQKVLDRYTETRQWKKAVEIMVRFAELDRDPVRKGKYYYAAAVTCRDEVKSLDEAAEYFNQALDHYFSEPEKATPANMPGFLKAFEALDKIYTMKKDWENLARAYRRQIKRMGARPGDKVLTMLWHNLGEIYRSRLKKYQTAAEAFEVAAQMEPENKQRHEILAELYVLAGPDMADKAIREHMTMLKSEPFKIDSYKALRKIYMDTHQYDKAWCICNTLAFLKKTDPEEQQFYETYRPKGFVKAKQRVTDESWKKIFHPDLDRYVSAILGAIWQGAAMVRAQEHKAFGLKRKDRRAIETDQLLFSKVFYYVSQVLNVPMPEVYLQPEQPGEVLLANCVEKGQFLPSFVVRANLLQGRPEREIAFAAAKQLTYMRPEFYLKLALPTNTEIKVAFMSALLLVQPNFPLKPDMVPLVQQYLPVLRSKIQPQFLEQLHHVVRQFLQKATDVDLVKWGNAVEATAHRVGFILCGDLEVAAKMVSMEPAQVGGPQAKEKIKELVLYSISEDYFAVRQQLGTVIEQSR